MAQQWNFRRDRAGWAGAIAGAFLASYPIATLAQVTGDGTLGTQVNGALTAPCTGTCIITNGATKGSNLFHSLRQFSLPNGDFAGFVTTPAIQNVIVRVTGVGQPFISNINGTIATVNAAVTAINPANFFLINPNGIIFGPNASLLIGGSFLATTANRMQFADGTEFRTDDPAPLLTVSVPTGLQFNAVPGSIQMQGVNLSSGNADSFSDFALLGGDVTLNNSIVFTPGRRVELGGVGENGSVDLRLNRDGLGLNFTAGTPRRDITLSNGSTVDVTTGSNGGEVAVTGRNIVLSGSNIYGGISPGIDNAATNQAGDFTIDATANLQLTQNSIIDNSVLTNAIGQAGNIRIIADNIQVRDASVIGGSTRGNGSAGNVWVMANTIALDGTTPDGQFPSGIFSEVFETGNGHAGDVIIETSSLTLTHGATVDVSTFGNGSAGNVRVIANSIALDGIGTDGLAVSKISSQVFPASSGQGGDITIKTGSLTVTNGAVVSAGTDGNGDAGSVTVTANSIALDGTTLNDQDGSAIGSQVGFTSSGRGGDVTVEAGSLTVTNGAVVSVNTLGNGNAGNVTVTAKSIALDGTTPDGQGVSAIGSQVSPTGSGHGGEVTVKTGSLTVTNGAVVSAGTFGNGDAGNVVVTANSIALDGTTPNTQGVSGINSQVGTTGSGNGGKVTVKTGSLTVTNGAGVSASTYGNGNAGNVVVTANSIALDGTKPNGRDGSEISSQVSPRGKGRGGDVTVETNSLIVTNGAKVTASTDGQGDAGSIFVTADAVDVSSSGQIRTLTASSSKAGVIVLNVSDRLTLSGTNTGLFANTAPGSSGNGGSIFIDPRTVTIQDGARVAVDSQGSGTGGNIAIQAGRLELRDRGSITAETASAQGGNITLDVKDLILLRRNSLISATAGTAQSGGDGGNITIRTPFIVGVLGENSDITANAFQGNGGNINITTNGIYGLKFQPKLTPFSDITASSQFGINGTVTLNLLNVDPSRGLVALPIALTDPSQQISQNCTPGSKTSASSFVATGRGGIPLSPDEPLEGRAVVTQWVLLPEDVGEKRSEREGERGIEAIHPSIQPSSLVEAQSIVVGTDGTVELVANHLTSDRTNVWLKPAPCQVSHRH